MRSILCVVWLWLYYPLAVGGFVYLRSFVLRSCTHDVAPGYDVYARLFVLPVA